MGTSATTGPVDTGAAGVRRPFRSRRWAAAAALVALTAALVVLAAACTEGERPVLLGTGAVDEAADVAALEQQGGDEADGGDPAESGAATTQPPTTEPYPEITEETFQVTGDLRAMLSPSGVLLPVTAETATGYVVETPCGGLTTIAWGQPVEEVQVVLDPGHGGDEPGATNVPGLSEADLNLAVARRTAAELSKRSISVALTRNGDYRIPISRRAVLADLLGASALVSIHHNTPASSPSATPGTEVFVQSTSAQSRRLGGLVYEEVFAALSEFDVEWTSRDDAGVLVVLDDGGEDAYGIARYPVTPSALVELAYLANEKEAALLATTDYVEAAAAALADGIERYLTTEDPGTGFVDTPRIFNPDGATGGTSGCVDPPLD